MIDPTGLTTYSYDALNRLTSMTNNKGQTTTFSYDALGRRTSMTHANGVVTNYTYDAASQLLSLSHQLGATTVDSFGYSYDNVGNRKSKADNNGTANYTYDTLNRLVQAINPSAGESFGKLTPTMLSAIGPTRTRTALRHLIKPINFWRTPTSPTSMTTTAT